MLIIADFLRRVDADGRREAVLCAVVALGAVEKLHDTPMEAKVAQDQGMAAHDITALVAAGRALIANTIGRQRS